jgi:hypothetical protein
MCWSVFRLMQNYIGSLQQVCCAGPLKVDNIREHHHLGMGMLSGRKPAGSVHLLMLTRVGNLNRVDVTVLKVRSN